MESYLFKPILYNVKSFVRFESNVYTPDRKLYRPTNLVEEHLNKGNPTTSEVINSVLLNQKVSINQKELVELLSETTLLMANLTKVVTILSFFKKRGLERSSD